ncbi:baseplate multidomain protein megatron [Shinella sp. M31]|uniref:baseplate multidomain protein megatron n=1 Tax=Shinella sp. M31 TaxID=3368615 RepID=UPI003B9E81E1
MATLLFQAAGAALGSVFGPFGAILGRAAGALAGSVVDRSLLNGASKISGARLGDGRIPGADEGTAMSRVYGTARLGGTLIWATRFEEEVSVERAGGKASGPRVETFRYFANFAVGVCEGPIAGIRRVWADGRELDLTGVAMRLHRGTATQMPDPLIEAKQGAGNTPAYRGLAYVVFERLPLDTFGNRIPVLQFEVLKPVGSLEEKIRAVTIIPGSSEHGYDPRLVTEKLGKGKGRNINRNTLVAATDWEASIDELLALCPNLERVGLVVAWFGTDLRAGHCRIVPGVEVSVRTDESRPWKVCGIGRGAARVVSQSGGGPAYGGTPSDASVVAAIKDLKARGIEVYLYPFVLMDVPAGNSLPDPYGGAAQAPYPWRGRITCYPQSANGTAAAVSQIAAFVGSAEAGDFSVSGEAVTGPAGDEGFRRLILHYAHLAEAAGGVDGFLIGSEMRGLTWLRDGTGGFPFVSALCDLAADARAVLRPATKITYAADWSEYFGFQPGGSGEVRYHLDPLWASPAIDAVGIDNYMPLSDWQDGDVLSGNLDGFRHGEDVAAMRGQIAAGEGFDWYYASDAARRERVRSPITDGAAGKPGVFRYKDIESWWTNVHRERGADGVEIAGHTAWVPRSKPIWFTELGCPAVDKGPNQPNVFVDPKSAENALPYFSGEAILDHFDAAAAYGRATARSRRMADGSDRVLRLALPAVLHDGAAASAVEAALRDQRAGQRRISFRLPPTALGVTPGDVVRLTDGPEGRFLVTGVTDGLVREVEARGIAAGDSPAFAPAEGGRSPTGGAGPADAFAPEVVLLDLPIFETGAAEDFARVAAYAKPWRAMVVSSSDGSEGFRARARLERPARLGWLAAALPAGVLGRFDPNREIVLDLASGGLSAVDPLTMLNGANRLAVQAQNGGWEIVGFAGASEIAPGRWRLTTLLRSLFGTEDAMASGHLAGALAVVLDEAVLPLGLDGAEVARVSNWLVEAVGAAGGQTGPLVFAGGERALTPLAPVHLRGRRGADGVVRFSWVRRGRIDADTWLSADIPLDEPSEAYWLEILSGGCGGAARRDRKSRFHLCGCERTCRFRRGANGDSHSGAPAWPGDPARRAGGSQSHRLNERNRDDRRDETLVHVAHRLGRADRHCRVACPCRRHRDKGGGRGGIGGSSGVGGRHDRRASRHLWAHFGASSGALKAAPKFRAPFICHSARIGYCLHPSDPHLKVCSWPRHFSSPPSRPA